MFFILASSHVHLYNTLAGLGKRRGSKNHKQTTCFPPISVIKSQYRHPHKRRPLQPPFSSLLGLCSSPVALCIALDPSIFTPHRVISARLICVSQATDVGRVTTELSRPTQNTAIYLEGDVDDIACPNFLVAAIQDTNRHSFLNPNTHSLPTAKS